MFPFGIFSPSRKNGRAAIHEFRMSHKISYDNLSILFSILNKCPATHYVK
jgi:hypothetical protein